ncbi:MAG TPA: methyltransferase, partial [Propionicimonas sp.]
MKTQHTQRRAPQRMVSPEPPESRLPALGRRGGGWVAIQVVLVAVAVAAGLLGAPWPAAAQLWLWIGGGAVLLGGLALLVGGGAGLGRQLTPFPRPTSTGELRQDGVYGLVRHPMYGGALVAVLGWSLVSSPLALVPFALAAVFLDAKRRREEAWMLAQYP